jgi:hypothetical protein
MKKAAAMRRPRRLRVDWSSAEVGGVTCDETRGRTTNISVGADGNKCGGRHKCGGRQDQEED